MKSFERPKSLTELVSDSVRHWIVSGELDLGSHLSEAIIAKNLQVSRTPVREAINRLEIEGLLTVEPQRGTFVFSLQPAELAKLCDARVCLETAALTSAISHHPDELSTQLANIFSKMTDAREQKNDSAYLALDADFHQSLFDHSGNRFLNDAYQAFAQKVSAIRNRLGRHPEHMTKSYLEHGEILDAVKSRDVARAVSILQSHIGRKEGSYWSEEINGPKVEDGA